MCRSGIRRLWICLEINGTLGVLIEKLFCISTLVSWITSATSMLFLGTCRLGDGIVPSFASIKFSFSKVSTVLCREAGSWGAGVVGAEKVSVFALKKVPVIKFLLRANG